MLSHLRFHRRGPASSPSSPVPDQQPPPSFFANHESAASSDALAFHDDALPASGGSSLPPLLPPITRVTSTESEPQTDWRRDIDVPSLGDSRQQQPPRQASHESGFIGGLALQNYRRGAASHAAGRPETADGATIASENNYSQSRHPQPAMPGSLDPHNRPTYPQTGQPKSSSSFMSPTELQHVTSPPVGRRPAGTRLTSEPPMLAAAATPVAEQQRGKKGLPFLKNPMSTLLLRRKNTHNAPDILPLPLHHEEPAYDPRIRGTRVHDFSAPRRKQHRTPSSEATTSRSPTRADAGVGIRRRTSESPEKPPSLMQQASYVSSASESASASIASQPLEHSTSTSSRQRKLSTGRYGDESQTGPPVPPKDETDLSYQKGSSVKHRQSLQDGPAHTKSIASMHSAQSRKPSRADRTHRDTISSIPKHMKSTSSRFSFDLVGAAKQEQLLEERHRQRELEKQVTDGPRPRDSHYDDFDEDAMYEAMMEEDDMEEPIPGMNADDYDENDYIVNEDESVVDDPDNDQENFEGFVFQRSNPTSSLASPQYAGALATPRDATGQVIGFAMTKDSAASNQQSPLSPFPPQEPLPIMTQPSGLGIHGMTISDAEAELNSGVPDTKPDFQNPPNIPERDELDFGNGVMAGFENEFAEDLAAGPLTDSVPFDESMFDNNDTDQYGRPVPGAFAEAQARRQNMLSEPAKRESDMTSRLSAQSDPLESTAHTSMSAGQNKKALPESPKHSAPPSPKQPEVTGGREPHSSHDPMAVYQAALVAAAHKAVASGKLQQEPSPTGDGDDSVKDDDFEDNRFDPSAYEDDGDDLNMPFSPMDDYDLDDDAIIAEANASALANDSDGWYGQEFGFYSAPASQHYGSHGSGSSSQPDYEYYNGGVFGPKGMDGVSRTKSGRVISREPNLTPITERSEYSNRNSVMSLVPPLLSGTPSMQSPGLAQLVMMAERDDQMSLSALMRLRSKAWGGSQISLSSSREGSPRSDRGDVVNYPWGGHTGSLGGSGYIGHARKNSVLSTTSRDSDANSPPGSPTLTGIDLSAAPAQPTGPPPPVPLYSEWSGGMPGSSAGAAAAAAAASQRPLAERTSPPEGSEDPGSAISGEWNWGTIQPARGSSRRPGLGHHPRSSADSISYIQEEEGPGETRWVMERRRTGESGQIEILGREVVEGGRI